MMTVQPARQYFARLDEHSDIIHRDVRMIRADDYTHVRPFSRQGIERLLEDEGILILRTDLPFVWRVLATPDVSTRANSSLVPGELAG